MTATNDEEPKILDVPIGLDATGMRREFDSLGQVEVSANRYWGAQTQRSLEHFNIGHDRMPKEVYHAYGYVKKAAAIVNTAAGRLPAWKGQLIERVCDEVISGAAGHRVPAVRVADRFRDPVEHERQRGHLQPVHPAGRRDAGLPGAGPPERSREHGPVVQRHVPDCDAHRRVHDGHGQDDPGAEAAAGRHRRQVEAVGGCGEDRPHPPGGRGAADGRPGMVRLRRGAGRRDRRGRARHRRAAGAGHGRHRGGDRAERPARVRRPGRGADRADDRRAVS